MSSAEMLPTLQCIMIYLDVVHAWDSRHIGRALGVQSSYALYLGFNSCGHFSLTGYVILVLW